MHTTVINKLCTLQQTGLDRLLSLLILIYKFYEFLPFYTLYEKNVSPNYMALMSRVVFINNNIYIIQTPLKCYLKISQYYLSIFISLSTNNNEY